MKIVSVGLYNPIPVQSGVDAYISYLLNPLGKNNEVTHYYFYKSKNKNKNTANDLNFRSEHIPSNFFKNEEKLPRLIRLLRPDVYFDKRSVKHINADVVICDTFTFDVAHYIAKKNKCPIVMIKHNIEWKYLKNDNSKLYPLLKLYEQFTNKKSDTIITISMNDFKYMVETVDENKVFYVPHKINTRVFNPKGPSYDFGNRKLHLLFYGSLDRPMNVSALEFIKHRLIPELKEKKILDKVQINIFGSGNPPKSLDIENDKNINFLGLVDDPGYYIRGADLIIVPLNNSGGVKIRLLESLFCGKPVIATDAAADGLSDELKKLIYIKNDSQGFAEIIKHFVHGKKSTLSNVHLNQLMKQMKGTTMSKVITSCIIHDT